MSLDTVGLPDKSICTGSGVLGCPDGFALVHFKTSSVMLLPQIEYSKRLIDNKLYPHILRGTSLNSTWPGFYSTISILSSLQNFIKGGGRQVIAPVSLQSKFYLGEQREKE